MVGVGGQHIRWVASPPSEWLCKMEGSVGTCGRLDASSLEKEEDRMAWWGTAGQDRSRHPLPREEKEGASVLYSTRQSQRQGRFGGLGWFGRIPSAQGGRSCRGQSGGTTPMAQGPTLLPGQRRDWGRVAGSSRASGC